MPRFSFVTRLTRVLSISAAITSTAITSAAIASVTGCGAPSPASHAPRPSASASSSLKPKLAPACRVAASAFEDQGDLDQALVSLAGCDQGDFAAAAHRIDILVELGDIDAAKILAKLLVGDAERAADPEVRALADRARDVLALASPPAVDTPDVDGIAAARADIAATFRQRKGADAVRHRAIAQHALARAYGTRGERVVVSRWAGGAWAGDRPAWDVSVKPIGGVAPQHGLAVGTQKGDTITLDTFIPGTDPANPPIALPDHPSSFAVRTTNGVLLRPFGRAPQLLGVSGTPLLSHDGRTFAIVSAYAVDLFDVATWTGRAHIQTASQTGESPSFSRDDKFFFAFGSNSYDQAFIDVQRGSIWATDGSPTAVVSPDEKLVACLDPNVSGAVWRLTLHPLGDVDRPHRIDVPAGSSNPGLVFRGDRVVVTEGYTDGAGTGLTAVAAVSTTGAKLALSKEDRAAAAAASYADVMDSLKPLLPKGILFVGPPAAYPAGPDAQGHFASVASRCLDARCSTSDAVLVVFDTIKKALLQTVPLSVKDGFSSERIGFIDDGRFAFVCGSGTFGTGAFVVDIGTGRSTLVGGISGCWQMPSYRTQLWTADGVRDLGADPSSDRWPPLAKVDLAVEQADGTVPTDGGGIYCRFGDVLDAPDTCASKN